MTDVIKEEIDINETFDSTRKMVHGEPPKGTIAYGRMYGPYTAKGYPRKRPNPNKPPEQVDEVLTKSMGQFIKDFIKSKNPEAVDEVTMRRTIPTKQERLARNKYYANHNIALSAEKRRAGIENYPGREDPIIGNLKGTFKKNSEKDKAANEEVSLDEGRGRPPKPGSAAYKRRQSEGGGDSDTPGLHGQLIKHKSLQNAPPKIKFTNGEEAHISAEHRDRAIKHLEGMIGPGKNPEARDRAGQRMAGSLAGFKQAIGVEPKPEGTKSPMSAQKAPPTLSLTKDESNMSQKNIVEKLQAALDAGILSQNDFDKLTQIAESPDQWRYSGSVGRSANTNTHKNYTLDIPGDSELGDYHDDDLHDMISSQNPHLEHHEVSAIVNSAGDETSKQKVEHAGKKYTHHVVNHQEPERLYDEVNYTGNPIDEGNSTKDYFRHLHRINELGGNSKKVKEHIQNYVPTDVLKSIHRNMDKHQHSDLFAAEIARRKANPDIKIKRVPKMDPHSQKTYDTKGVAGYHEEEVEAVDDKALVGKQKNLDKNRNGKLDAQDFKMIRKEETTAGVAAVVAALSRNLKELK